MKADGFPPEEIAFLFSDVEDSTRLWQSSPQAMQVALARHDAILRRGIEAAGGHVFKTAGDAFHASFDEPRRALEAAVAMQQALHAETWPQETPIRVRMALVAGAAQRRDGDYFGPPLNVVGRLLPIARGGQTLITRATYDSLADARLEGIEAESHGFYQLKGLEDPVEILEVGAHDHAPFAPPVDTNSAYRVVRMGEFWQPVREVRHNLPRERDAFVGRAADLAAVAARLDSGARLVTVVGPGGTGKTRLVRRYGWTWRGDWPGGVYFCDLSDARTLDGVFFVVAVALDVPLSKGDPGVQLGHAIAARGRCLIILDNFEQIVLHAEASVGRWLDRTNDAAFLVTSRERLRLAGEEMLPLEPLPVDTEGMELLALRARMQRSEFALTPANLAIVKSIVALLDGLPLAIELAAARIRVMSPAQLLERLTDRFGVLAGARSAADRQATLKNAIDWSWNLLLPWEQAALAQCSVFEGGFTLDAAEAVVQLSIWADPPSVMNVVQALVDKSLLRTWVPIEQTRHELEEPYFGMYLTIHDYAADKLAASGEEQRAAEERHGRHFAGFVTEDRLRALDRRDGGVRRRALTLELDNFVAACKRAVAREDSETAVASLRATWVALKTQGPFELAINLGAQVDTLADIAPSLRAAALTTVAQASIAAGRLESACARLDRALALARTANDPVREATVLAITAHAKRQQGRMDEARRHAEQALTLRSALGEEDAVALTELGVVQRQTGAMEEARAAYERALAIDRKLGDADSEAKVLNSLAIVHAEQGRFDEARAHFESALALSREIGDRRQAGLVIGNLGVLNFEQGRRVVGREQCEAALAIHRDTGERIEEGNALANLAGFDREEGHVDDARAKLTAALAISREVGNRRSEGVFLEYLGVLEKQQGRIKEARVHFDEALALHRAVSNRRNQGAVLTQLGELLIEEGRLDEALTMLGESETHLRAIDEKANLVLLLCQRGRLELAMGEPARALASLEEAKSSAEALRLDSESSLWKDIAALSEAIGEGGLTAR